MRVMILAKTTPEGETRRGTHDPEFGQRMARFSEELVAAGVLLGEGALEPSAKGARLRFEGGDQTVIDGPFTESEELVAGYWLWQVRSLDEAIEWLKRAPFPDGMEVELRPVMEMPDGPAADGGA